MTEISFHFNAPDKVGYACRLLRKAVASGAWTVVTAEAALLRELDVALWTFAAQEFVPHCMQGDAAALIDASPVLLADTPAAAPARHDVLVNLGTSVPDGFERFGRLIEVVSRDDADRALARARWRRYADLGYALVRHDLAAANA